MAEFDVKCVDCGAVLDAVFNGYSPVLEVTPCKKCMEVANDKGYNSGFHHALGDEFERRKEDGRIDKNG